jgi:ribose transport system permease protein
MDRIRRVLAGHADLAWPFAIVVVLLIVGTAVASSFIGIHNLRSVGTQASFIGLAAAGQAVVIITGGVDLSIPWVMTSSALLLGHLVGVHNDSLVWALPVVLAYAAAIGLVNGIGVAAFGISPIIMTLAMNTILSGTSSIFSSSLSEGLPTGVQNLGSEHLGPFSADFLIWVVAGVAVSIFLAVTVAGRRVYAVGANPRVARFSGVNVAGTRILAYTVSALTAACAGIMVGGYGGQAFGGLGDPYLFASVAAVAIGGVSIYGGSGNYIGVVGGALIIALLTALLPLLGLSSALLDIVYGAVILVAMLLARSTDAFGALRSSRPSAGS